MLKDNPHARSIHRWKFNAIASVRHRLQRVVLLSTDILPAVIRSELYCVACGRFIERLSTQTI